MHASPQRIVAALRAPGTCASTSPAPQQLPPPYQVFQLKAKLRAISRSLQTFTRKQEAREASGEQIESNATDVLRHLELLRSVERAPAPPGDPGERPG